MLHCCQPLAGWHCINLMGSDGMNSLTCSANSLTLCTRSQDLLKQLKWVWSAINGIHIMCRCWLGFMYHQRLPEATRKPQRLCVITGTDSPPCNFVGKSKVGKQHLSNAGHEHVQSCNRVGQLLLQRLSLCIGIMPLDRILVACFCST